MRCALLFPLLIAACGAPPTDPLSFVPAVDRVVVRTAGPGGAELGGGLQSGDLHRINALLEIARGDGDWERSWNTIPAGEVRVELWNGHRLVGTVWFGDDFVVARADTVTRIRRITPADHDSLEALTIWWPPRAADYATSDTLTGPAAPVDYRFDPEARRFRSQLEGRTVADFAGHFAFVVWGCGTECTSHMVLDLRTGRPYDDTLINFSCGRPVYDPHSTLVVVEPASPGDESCLPRPTRYLAWNGTRLEPIPATWALEDTLSVASQSPAAPVDSAGERRVRALMAAIDAGVGAGRSTQTFFGRLESGAVIPVEDLQDPPAEMIDSYEIVRDADGTIVRATESPTSESGDGVVTLTHYFGPDGATIAVEQYIGMVTGCLLPTTEEGGEDQSVSTGETATWVFDLGGRTLAKHYRREAGTDRRDLTTATGCRTDQQFTMDKYRTLGAWLTATGLREVATGRAAH